MESYVFPSTDYIMINFQMLVYWSILQSSHNTYTTTSNTHTQTHIEACSYTSAKIYRKPLVSVDKQIACSNKTEENSQRINATPILWYMGRWGWSWEKSSSVIVQFGFLKSVKNFIGNSIKFSSFAFDAQ